MKKIVVLLSIIVLLLTGCSVTKLDNYDYGKNIKTLLSESSSMFNVFYDGYKYYLPKGVGFIKKDDYNAVLKDGNDNKYYLYVDVISYYHKTDNDYAVLEDVYYSKKLNYNKKSGYIQINKVDSKYFIQFVYNYAKLEALVDENDLVSTVDNMCYILRSVKFNRKVLESLIGENSLDYKEENYSLFDAESSDETFLSVVEKYETDDYKKDLEDEKIDLDE